MSTKHRQWAGALARDCGIPTMFQQTAQPPASNPAPTTDEPRAKRPYRQHDARERAAMRLAVYRGATVADVATQFGVHQSVVYRAVRELPRPVQEPGEGKHRYGIRVQTWMRQIDPDYAAKNSAARSRGQRLAARRRRREAEKTAQPVAPEPTPAPPPVVIDAPQPVAAIAPPWGFQSAGGGSSIVSPLPPPPRVGFWRALGMMLGVVR